jgi:protein-S-isoprenylcysteine O-methyltransferase Ste14
MSQRRAIAGGEVANLGLVRPPLVYLCSIALGLLIQLAAPVRLVPPGIGAPVGSLVTLGAIALFLVSLRTLRAARTSVRGNRPTRTIVRQGPYRFTRNPIYLAFSLLQIGVALLANSVWLLVTLIPAVALMSLVVIPKEEQYLTARFPEEYPSYTRAVRRWL